MNRDGITREEAEGMINECKAYLDFCIENGDYEEAYYATQSILGLEPDYLDMMFIA